MRKKSYFYRVLFMCALMANLGGLGLCAQNSLIINEIVGSNTWIFDEDGDSPDWIEVYNGTEKDINLKGWGLSDKPDNLARWIFPERSISPGEYLVVFASGKDRTDPDGVLHANFKLSGKDKGVYLSDDRGILRDSIAIEKLPQGVSFGRHAITGEFVYFPSVTPGKANTSAAFSPVVKYSVRGGFYPSPFSVKLYTDGKDSTIYYTMDGSEPTVASKIYSGPVTVSCNATIRAISLKKGFLPSPPSGQTYFVDFDNKGMAVVAVAAEEEKLWDKQRGLFRDVSYKDYMLRDSVRVHVSYFDEKGNQGFSQDASMGVVGASSREVMMRPLKISADPAIDPMNSKFRYRLLANNIDEYRHFQLRNNNQDGIRYLDDPECLPSMGIRNALFCEIVRGREGIEIRDDNGPVLFFINGKNYGMMNIGEKRDNTGISDNNPSVKSGDVDLITVRNDMGMRVERHKLGEGTVHIRQDAKVVYKGYFEDGAVEYEEISESAKRSGSTKGIDDFISLDPADSSQLDPKSFIASMAAHVIACNTDFGMNNIGFWREAREGEKPGPFHIYSFDFDSVFGLEMWREDYDTLLVYLEDTHLFPAFIEKEEYKLAFIRKIDEFLNGPFSPENALSIIDKLERKMDPWIEYHLEKWAGGLMDKDKWKKNVENLRKYISVRPKFVRMFIRDFFGFSGYSDMEFSVIPQGGGCIFMDTGIFNTPLTGIGTYANIPIKIRASASRGYSFSHFDIGGARITDQVYTFTPEESMKIQAVFLEDPKAFAADIVINEVVASSGGKIEDEDGEKQDWIELYNTTERKIDLKGMHLTDNEKKLARWTFPDVSIGPGSFMVVFASGKNRTDPAGNLHTDFKLSSEPVLIVDRDGKTVIDRMTFQEVASIPKGSSGIRFPDGSSLFRTSELSTPGCPNAYGQSDNAGGNIPVTG
ncbi:MAG: lamin tail domain-containing protein [Candidatus Omnitrophota bacterium]